jgi:N-acetylneuraminic acid mutarotase
VKTLKWILTLALLTLGTTFVVHAQNPMTLRWDKAAPFPEPEEELYGIAAGGKMYVIGGFSENGKPAPAMVYEYDAATDKWTKKKPIPVPVHHQAQAELNGKIYIFGGCQRPLTGPGAGGWQPVDNSWEYDPKTDAYRALAPMPIKRCSAIAEQINGKFYVIGGGTIQDNSGETALFGDRPQRILATNQMYDPATNTWTNKSPMNVARNHAFGGVVNGKIYVIGGRIGAVHVTASSNTDVVEEYDPAKDLWSGLKARMPTPRSGGGWATYNGRIYIAGGEGQHERASYSFRAVEAYEPATNRWIIFPSMPQARHGAAGAFIGNKFHLVSGKPEGGGLPDLAFKGLPAHDVLTIPDNLSTY